MQLKMAQTVWQIEQATEISFVVNEECRK